MPKSSSPKRSPKKSPGGKNSPRKKNSPGKNKPDAEPPIEIAVQTEPATVCYLCMRSFNDSAAIQAHLVLMNHMAPFDCKDQQCRACHTVVNIKDLEHHKCPVMKANFLRLISCPVSLDMGPPYRCLFCRSRPYESRVELAMHLLCLHRPDKPPGVCGMCKFTYDEPPQLPPPNIPALPANADEEKRLAHAKELKAAKEKQMCEPSDIPTPGLDSLLVHVRNEHVPAYTLWSRRQLLEDSGLRFPYSCPICNWPSKSNYGLHAHILGCHGNASQIRNDLKICSFCGFPAGNDTSLNQHIVFNHTEPLVNLGNLWIRKELMMNVTDPGTTCVYCWQTFRNDFQLQAHLLVVHVTNNVLRCGWCKVDFTSCSDPILACMIMQHHEYNHGLQLHQIALQNQYTLQPLSDPLPEVPDKELLIAARMSLVGGGADSPTSKKGKKGSPKKSPQSPKSKSPKSGSKSKRSSPKK
ncbi:hypothetical protein CRM22_006054 [Opisthorchis felineus]|uniref:C2H2-type domain-containing protein n=1 Tax=Opisthorchis felineus TaxID=147828 RepID=A0A4S2LMY9_OPIFE|nr:hypothetical protein CRM22_006054 [Opisthorchis felineus]